MNVLCAVSIVQTHLYNRHTFKTLHTLSHAVITDHQNDVSTIQHVHSFKHICTTVSEPGNG